MFLLQWQRKAVDDGAEDLEQFGNAVESFGLVYELEEDVVDRAANVRAEVQELPVDTMEGGLEEVALSGVFRVEQLQELCGVSVSNAQRVGRLLTFSTKLWSMYAFAMFVLKS